MNMKKKILIIGAGYAGKAVAAGIVEDKIQYNVVGFLDNDDFKVGKKFLGIEVKDKSDNLKKFLKSNKVSSASNKITLYFISISF